MLETMCLVTNKPLDFKYSTKISIPACILQDEVKKAEKAAVRERTKAAVFEGDPECTDLVACIVYDTKPVHLLSTACIIEL
jgi:hypothetical protein